MLASVAVLALAGPASAHRLAPSLLELVETAPGRFDVTWKTPREQPAGSEVRPELPADCAQTGDGDARAEDSGLVVRFQVDCGSQGLLGRSLAVRGLASSGSNALLRVALLDGRRIQAVLHPGDEALAIGPRQGALEVARDYALLGFDHILTGLDHLLFVFGLLLLAATSRQLVYTVTCFTLGHSVTLSLAVLGYVAFPSALVELVIAGTILALALELARPTPPRPSWMRRVPWAMSFAFGLLHGLGFAGALSEVGLPPDEIPAALFAFNLGIEAGQLAFVVSALLLGRVFAGAISGLSPTLRRVPVYAMGGLAVYWCLDRGTGLLS